MVACCAKAAAYEGTMRTYLIPEGGAAEEQDRHAEILARSCGSAG